MTPLYSTRSVWPRFPMGITSAVAGGATARPRAATVAITRAKTRRPVLFARTPIDFPLLIAPPRPSVADSHDGTSRERRGRVQYSGRPGTQAADLVDADAGQQAVGGVGR